MKFFDKTILAKFVSRPNRFIVRCELDHKPIIAYMPNPGRLQELLWPGVTVYLEPNKKPEAKQKYVLVAVDRNGYPVMLHTHKNNDVAQWLLENHQVPGLEQAKIIKREVTVGHSRYDFLLMQGQKEIYLEVKSCTLFSQHLAMFPDAITDRGKRHLEGLAQLTSRTKKGMVLFIVHANHCNYFLPEFHTDIEFSKTLYNLRESIKVQAISVKWNKSLELGKEVKSLTIPWERLENRLTDSGHYLIILKNIEPQVIEVGKLGKIKFESGYYIYVGSAHRALTARIARHKRLRKNKYWHIDYLRAKTEFVASLSIRGDEDIECRLNDDLATSSDWQIQDFGSSDCRCKSHLLGYSSNPIHRSEFHRLLQFYRMDRLVKSLISK